MSQQQLLQEIKSRLMSAYGARLRGLVLYGSEARGTASPDSDVDLLVLLEEPLEYGQDLERNLEALYPLALRIGRRISAKPVAASEYESVDCPLYRAARAEGVQV